MRKDLRNLGPVEYADGRRGAGEAVRSLGRYLGVTETRAAELLKDPAAYGTEIRAWRDEIASAAGDPYAARRSLERRYLSP